MAVTAARKTDERAGKQISQPVEEAVVIHKGSMVALNAAGFAVPVTEATTLNSAGMAEESVDNTDGADGDVRVTIRYGVFKWTNASAGDAIARADIGNNAYGVDNDTVSDVATGRSIVGTIVDIDADGGIWVLMSPDSVAKLTDLDTP
jgi:hypothetical protein